VPSSVGANKKLKGIISKKLNKICIDGEACKHDQVMDN
jgi:hypothetical protein